jgi:hypothetical protein
MWSLLAWRQLPNCQPLQATTARTAAAANVSTVTVVSTRGIRQPLLPLLFCHPMPVPGRLARV